MKDISEFRIQGLFGTRDVALHIRDNKIILVGPNGLGKSSVVNIFYLFVSRQWSRLLEYAFNEISITIDGTVISAKREEISGLSDFNRVFQEYPGGGRVSRMLSHLVDAGLVEKFFSSARLSAAETPAGRRHERPNATRSSPSRLTQPNLIIRE